MFIARLVLLAVVVFIPVFAASASADDGGTVTISRTETIPVPPASNYAGQAGGDGWGVGLSSDRVYNVFHHNPTLQFACHFQSGQNAAQPCWSPMSVRQPNGDGSFGFSSTGQPGVYVDQRSGKVYTYSTRSDGTAGVVCFDPSQADAQGNPFCGFTQLSAVGDATLFGYSNVSNPVQVGSRWYAFNFYDGAGVGPGARNELLCFDLVTFGACAGQPFAVKLATGQDSPNATVNTSLPGPAIAAIGNDVVIPVNFAERDELACFDGAQQTNCSGTWPTPVAGGYVGSYGAPIPLLTANGTPTGACFPGGSVPCYSLQGADVQAATPENLPAAVAGRTGGSVIWNGPAVQIGPRIYVPRWGNEVDCYDYNQNASCSGFPSLRNGSSGLYTVNKDPLRATCLWVNSDGGSAQIQNFDAFDPTKGCGEGPTTVAAESFIVNTTPCLPGQYTSLQVLSPARSAYDSATVSFVDGSNEPIPGASPVSLDQNGTAALTGLNLNTATGLPLFLITFNTGNNPRPGSVTVKLTWQGSPDPACLQPDNGSGGGTTTGPTAGPPPQSDVGVTDSGPVFARVGSTVTFTDTLKNNGKNTATGVVLTSPMPAGATFVSAKISNGNTCAASTTKLTCFVGTLNSGSSATVTVVYTANQTGTLTHSVNVQADYDTNPANNVGSASTPIIAQGAEPPAPPKPAAPGTFNAIATGTVLVNGQPVTPDQVFLIKAGDVIDVTNGTITITDFDGGFGTFGNVQPSPQRRAQSLHGTTAATAGGPVAIFQIDQAAQAGAGVTLSLVQGDFSVCTTPRRLSAANTTPVRQLWGKAHGLFTTKGRYSAATIRGTIWLEQDRCDGSFTSAIDDVVTVQDLVKNTTVTLNPGQTYLATPKAPFKPPAVKKHKAKGQTAATIRKRGLLWGHQLFVNKAQFTTWLEQRGSSWAQFAAKNPKFAEALASRK